MIKLSKTSSLQKLFDYDCVTLYIFGMCRPQFEEFFPEMTKGKAMADLVFR